ncbi:hypothetical protein SPMU_24450 [Sphingomonas mucosissima]|uniref:Uncharacterized protein n=1 Tax=Sphingomonas mucosissima TaxID=370959 RepID=A0A245ZGQ9_9SPHN|nr:hypothetical protein SPMU_24450 [Sphingomonas mucosissima]
MTVVAVFGGLLFVRPGWLGHPGCRLLAGLRVRSTVDPGTGPG